MKYYGTPDAIDLIKRKTACRRAAFSQGKRCAFRLTKTIERPRRFFEQSIVCRSPFFVLMLPSAAYDGQ